VSGELISWHDEMIHCTTSIGYASFPLAGTTMSISLDRAISLTDKALYQAKRRGRNRACRISGLHADSEAALAWISTDFEAATAGERVQLYEIAGAAR
jgi:predicted signal transduction protein with EAL and GGDEF domain